MKTPNFSAGRKNLFGFIAFACIVAPITASADTVVYDFTGTVTSSSGTYGSVATGASITGTVTFNYANATTVNSTTYNTNGSYGIVGSSGPWLAVSQGGSYLNLPPINGEVFSTTATVGNISYSDAALGTFDGNSYVFGSGGTTFNGLNTEIADSNYGYHSELSLTNPSGAYGANGLPILTGASAATGLISYEQLSGNAYHSVGGLLGTVNYNITSLTPAVPLPAAVWLMLSGLGGLGALIRRKRGVA